MISVSNPRLHAGFETAVSLAAICFIFLDPLFMMVGIELAVIAPYILTVFSGLVGMSVGILLPLPAPGACAGLALALLLSVLGLPGFGVISVLFATAGLIIPIR